MNYFRFDFNLQQDRKAALPISYPFDFEPSLALFAMPDEAAVVDHGLATDDGRRLQGELSFRLEAWRERLPKPTRGQMLGITHHENRMLVENGHDTAEFWQGLEAEWRRKQRPDFAPVQSDGSWPPEARTWLERERRSGRIFRNFEEANDAFFHDYGVKLRRSSEDNTAAPEAKTRDTVLSDYTHIKPIGKGYFAVVTHYRHRKTNEDVAVKQLKEEKYAYRFEREIRLMQALEGHPNILRLIDFEFHNGSYRHITKKADTNLYKYVKKHNATLSMEQRLAMFDQVLDAIEYAHSKNILHRDIAPPNVLVFDGEHVEVCDFGMGKDLSTLSNYTTSVVARYGQVYYVAPEQRDKLKDASERSDVYSLGKLLNFILTGRDPDVIHASDFNSVIARATQYEPDARYQTVSELKVAYSRLKSILSLDGQSLLPTSLTDLKNQRDTIDWHDFHRLAVQGDYDAHPYAEYIQPTIEILSHSQNLRKYYEAVGDFFGDFLKTFINQIDELASMTGWPFEETKTFARFLRDVFLVVQEPEFKISCLKEIWDLAYERDQWGAQSVMEGLLKGNQIPEEIQKPFAVHIIDSRVLRLPNHSDQTIPRTLRQALIVKSKEIDS